MKDGKIQTGLRIPETLYNDLRGMADRSGVSINSLILILVDIGMNAINHGTAKEAQILLRMLQRSSE